MSSPYDSNKLCIAVIDDEPEVLSLYRDIFEERYNVKSYSSPLEFLDALEKGDLNNIQLVISDYKMPKMTGLEMINQGHAKGHKFPALLLSGYVSKDVAVSALNSGISKILEKPASPDDIYSAALELIKNFRIHSIDEKIMEIGDQLSELYLLYRDTLLPDLQEPKEEEQNPETPMALVAYLEKQLVRLQMEKKVLSQLD